MDLEAVEVAVEDEGASAEASTMDLQMRLSVSSDVSLHSMPELTRYNRDRNLYARRRGRDALLFVHANQGEASWCLISRAAADE